MKDYQITILETRKMILDVDAETMEEALEKVKSGWENGEYVLDYDHIEDVKYEAEDYMPKKEMSYAELSSLFRKVNDRHLEPITGYVVFTEDSFNRPYYIESRTYKISSNNKAYQAGMGGFSIYGSCLDGSDPCLRLDGYMRADDGWKIEKCYVERNEYERVQKELTPPKTPQPRLPER